MRLNNYKMAIATFMMMLVVTLPIVFAQETASIKQGAASIAGGAKEVVQSGADVGKTAANLQFTAAADASGPGKSALTNVGLYDWGVHPIGEDEQTGEAIVVNAVSYEPPMIRSGLLEEDDVPVYVSLSGSTLGSLLGAASNAEPLYSLPNIKLVNVRPTDLWTQSAVSGAPRYVRPKKYTLQNLGFLAILLKKIEKESDMPPEINLSMTAEIYFEDSERTFSLFRQDMFLPERANEAEWRADLAVDSSQSSFFAKRGFIRAARVGDNDATLVFYSGTDLTPPYTGTPRPIREIKLNVGETSDYYRVREGASLMQDAFRVKLLEVAYPNQKRAKLSLNIDGTAYDTVVTEGKPLYPGSEWTVKSIETVEDKATNKVQVRVKMYASKGMEEASKVYFVKQSVGASQQQTAKSDPCASKAQDLAWLLDPAKQATALSLDKITTHLVTITGLDSAIRLNDGKAMTQAELAADLDAGGYIQLKDFDANGYPIFDYYDLKEKGRLPAVATISATTLMPNLIITFPSGMNDYMVSQKESDQNTKVVKIEVQVKTKQASAAPTASSSELDSAALTAQNFLDKLKNIDQEYVLCTAVQEYSKVFAAYPGVKDEEGASLADKAAFMIAESYDWLGYPEQAIQYYKKSLSTRMGGHVARAESKIGALERDVEQGASHVVARLDDTGRNVEVKVVDIYGMSEFEKPFVALDVQGEGTKSKMTVGSILFRNSSMESRGTQVYAYDWIITQISSNSIVVEKKYKGVIPSAPSITAKTLGLKSNANIEGKNVHLSEINAMKFAVVSIIPGTGKPLRSLSNFTIHIPIEKRAIKLNPEKILDKVNKTEKTIARLDNFIKNFDKMLSMWKKVCIFTFLFLTIKNSFLAGTSRNEARSLVLRGRDGNSGWSKYCKVNSGSGRLFSTFDKCMSENAGKITSQLDQSQEAIRMADEEIKDMKNQQWYQDIMSKYKGYDKYGGYLGRDLYSKTTMRDYRYWSLMKDSESYSQNAGEKIDKGISYNYQKEVDDNMKSFEFTKSVDSFNKAVDIIQAKYPGFDSKSEEEKRQIFQDLVSYTAAKQEDITSPTFFYLKKMNVKTLSTVRQVGTKIVSYSADGQVELKPATVDDYLAKLDELRKAVTDPYDKKRVEDDWNSMKKNYQNRLGTQIDSAQGKVYKTADGQFYVFKGSAMALTDKVRNTYDPLAPIEFYPDGKPYCVPSEKGNFIKILDFFNDGSPKTIQEWNVGTDGRMCTGDDVLVKHNSVLMTAEQNTYYRNLLTIANKFTNKKKGETVTISGKKWVVSDNAAGLKKDATSPTCYDVMDPNDCQTLFGVCDPVLCPPSRFNLAGNWKVDNVVQTGMIGSIFLGLHNFNPPKEMVPVCLTGISAGLKSIKSVLEGYVQCMKVAYVQGKTVGICDKIRSVYTCEIIWKEALALLKMKGGLMKWVTSRISGGGSEGGNEYSKFQDALKNTEASANFFFKEYSSTAFASFNARSTQEIGTTICKRAIYGKMPKFGELLDQLATPEDPPQYTAVMSESVYSETQSLSQYQVYYHIYAGKTSKATVTSSAGFFDTGGIANTGTNAQAGLDYSVFVKNDLGNVFYITEKCQGRRSFIKQGGLADFTVDCVAAKGFNQVCITINGDTKCGFGKVSTSFAINYVNDLIVAEEAKKKIASEEECAPTNPSGSPGVLAVASATQAGAISPGILGAVGVASDFASTGIRRICAIDNPGKGTNPLDFKVVGSCGKDAYGNLLGSCWIDMRSVSVKDVETMNSVNKVLDEETMKKAKELAGVMDTLDATKSKARLAELGAQPQTTCRDFYSLVLGYRDLESRSLDPESAGRAQYGLGVALDKLARDKECAKYNPDREFKKLMVEFQNALILLKAQYYKEATGLQDKNKNNPQLSILLSDIASKYGKEMDTSYQSYKSKLAELEKKEGKEAPKFKEEIERIYAEQKQSMVMTGLLKAEVKTVSTEVAQAQRVQCGQCQSGAAGSLFCTSDKCHKINPYCYLYQDKKYLGGISVDPFSAQCMTCADAKECSAFNFDKAMCNDEGQCKEMRGGFACKYIGEDGKGMCMPAVNTVQAKAQEKCGECHKGKTGTFSIMMTAVSGSSLCTPATCQSKGDDCYFKQQNGDNLCLPCSMASSCEEMGESFCKNVVCNRAANKICEWDAVNKKCLTKGTIAPTVPTTSTGTCEDYYNQFPGARVLAGLGDYYVSPTSMPQSSGNVLSYQFPNGLIGATVGTDATVIRANRQKYVDASNPSFVPTGTPTFSSTDSTQNFWVTSYFVVDCQYYGGAVTDEFKAKIRTEGSGICNGKCYDSNANVVECPAKTSIMATPKPLGTIAVNNNPNSACYIPYGSYVYVKFNNPTYSRYTGWFVATDTGRQSRTTPCWLDVYRGVQDSAYDTYKSQGISTKYVDVWVYPIMSGKPSCTSSGSATLPGSSTIPTTPTGGAVVDNIVVRSTVLFPGSEITLNPSQVCPADTCYDRRSIFSGFPRPAKVTKSMVVLHTTEGVLASGSISTLLSKSQSKNVALTTHYMIERDGRLYWLSDEKDSVWHANSFSLRSVGIEIANAGGEPRGTCDTYCKSSYVGKSCTPAGCYCTPDNCKTLDEILTPAQLAAAQSRTDDLKVRGSGYWTNYQRYRYEQIGQTQMMALVKLVAEIMIRNNLNADQLGRHIEACAKDGCSHGDPEPSFPYDDFKAEVAMVLGQYYGLAAASQATSGMTPITTVTATSLSCDNTELKFAAVGDSLTAVESSTFKRWPDWLKEKCPKIKIDKIGAMGLRTDQILTEFRRKNVADNYDVIIIMGGTNDVAGAVTESTITSNLEAMYKLAKDKNKYVVALTIPPWKGHSLWTESKQQITDYVNQWIMLRPLDTPKYVDQAIDTQTLLGDNGMLKPAYGGGVGNENIHFTQPGHKAIADEIYNKVFSIGASSEPELSAESADMAALGVAEEYGI